MSDSGVAFHPLRWFIRTNQLQLCLTLSHKHKKATYLSLPHLMLSRHLETRCKSGSGACSVTISPGVTLHSGMCFSVVKKALVLVTVGQRRSLGKKSRRLNQKEAKHTGRNTFPIGAPLSCHIQCSPQVIGQ